MHAEPAGDDNQPLTPSDARAIANFLARVAPNYLAPDHAAAALRLSKLLNAVEARLLAQRPN